MITDFFISLLNSVVSLVPSFDFSFLPYSDSINTISNLFKNLNYYFPVAEMFFIINLVLAFYSFRLVYRIILWLASRIVI